MKTLLLYGLEADQTERYAEVLLCVKSTMKDIKKVLDLAELNGFHSFRVATHVDGVMPVFGAASIGGAK